MTGLWSLTPYETSQVYMSCVTLIGYSSSSVDDVVDIFSSSVSIALGFILHKIRSVQAGFRFLPLSINPYKKKNVSYTELINDLFLQHETACTCIKHQHIRVKHAFYTVMRCLATWYMTSAKQFSMTAVKSPVTHWRHFMDVWSCIKYDGRAGWMNVVVGLYMTSCIFQKTSISLFSPWLVSWK